MEGKVIVESLREGLKILNALDQEMLRVAENATSVKAEIMTLKANNSDLKSTDIEDLLLEFKSLNMQYAMMEDALRLQMYHSSMLYDMAIVAKVELDFEESQINEVKSLNRNVRPMYVINQAGSLEAYDKDLLDHIFKEIKNSTKDTESLTTLFNSKIFDPQIKE